MSSLNIKKKLSQKQILSGGQTYKGQEKMPKLNLVRRFKTVISDSFRRTLSGRLISTIGLIFVFCFLLAQFIDRRALIDVENGHFVDENTFEVNNYGSHVNLVK